MKRFRFLQVALIAALVVVAVSCGMPRSVSDEYYDDYPQGNGYYYGSPYGNRPVILERDPFTGRYYQVAPYGAYAYPAVPYGYSRGYSSRGYSRDYNKNYRNRDNDNRSRDNGYNGNRGGYNGYNNNNNRNNGNPGQTDQQRQQNREEARKRILGDPNNH